MRNTLPFVTLTANGSCRILRIRWTNIGKDVSASFLFSHWNVTFIYFCYTLAKDETYLIRQQDIRYGVTFSFALVTEIYFKSPLLRFLLLFCLIGLNVFFFKKLNSNKNYQKKNLSHYNNTFSLFTADSDTTEQPEVTQDILTCGSCQKTFALSDIVKFIQHKVLQCNKENYGQCFSQGNFNAAINIKKNRCIKFVFLSLSIINSWFKWKRSRRWTTIGISK